MSSNNTSKTLNTSNTKQLGQLRTDGKNIETYTYFIVIVVLGLILGLIYTNSRPYLVSKTNNKLYGIEKYLTIKSFDENMENKLKNFKIFSTTNPVNRYRLLGDYTSVDILRNILRLGVRYIELNVFAANFKYGSRPVVTNGYKTGQWKLMINSVDFEDCMKVIKENAFTDLTNINGSPNSKDPLFLGLNLHTGYNNETLDIVADIIIDYMADYLLEPKYSYQYEENFQDLPYHILKERLVIFSSPGFEGSKLEEIVNMAWIDHSSISNKEKFIDYFSGQKLVKTNEGFHVTSDTNDKEPEDIYDTLTSNIIKKNNLLRIGFSTISEYGFDTDYLNEFNKNGLTIVVPNDEGDIFPNNYDPSIAWSMGCQFVCLNFQYNDYSIFGNKAKYVDKYITHFKNSGMIQY